MRVDLHHDLMVHRYLRGSIIATQVYDIYRYPSRLIWLGGFDLTGVLTFLQRSLSELSNWLDLLILFSRESNRSKRRGWNQITYDFFFLFLFLKKKYEDLWKKTRDLISFFFLSCPTLELDLEKDEKNFSCPSHGPRRRVNIRSNLIFNHLIFNRKRCPTLGH